MPIPNSSSSIPIPMPSPPVVLPRRVHSPAESRQRRKERGAGGDVDLAALKKEIADYLSAFEKGREYKFAQKPLELKRLHLVAFVQDDATQDVLQATVVKVTGSLDIPTPKDSAK